MIYFHQQILFLLLFWKEFMPWSAFSQSHNLFLSFKPNTLLPTSTFLTWIHSPLSLSLFASAFTFSWSFSTFSSLLCSVFTFSSLPCSGQDSAPQSFKSCNLSRAPLWNLQFSLSLSLSHPLKLFPEIILHEISNKGLIDFLHFGFVIAFTIIIIALHHMSEKHQELKCVLYPDQSDSILSNCKTWFWFWFLSTLHYGAIPM